MIEPELLDYRKDIEEILGPDKWKEAFNACEPYIKKMADAKGQGPLEWAVINKTTNDRNLGKNAGIIFGIAIAMQIKIESN